MDGNLWRAESFQGDGLFNPKDDVISSSALIIAQIMVKADGGDLSCFEQSNGFVGPKNPSPAIGSGSLIIEIDAHD